MARIDVGRNGMLLLTLDPGESVGVAGGGQCLTLSLSPTAGLAATLGQSSPVANGNGSVSVPAALAAPADGEECTPLSASEAIGEILNAFQQVNVKMRAARERQGPGAPESPDLRFALQLEAMERVVAVCQGYLQGRDSAGAADETVESGSTPETPGDA